MSTSERVLTFGRPGEQQRFTAARPEICGLLKDASVCYWGWWIECEGSKQELLASGFAEPEMFEITTKTGTQTRGDEYGDQYTIKRLAKQRFRLTRMLKEDGAHDCVGNDRFVAWRERRESITAAVAERLHGIGLASKTR